MDMQTQLPQQSQQPASAGFFSPENSQSANPADPAQLANPDAAGGAGFKTDPKLVEKSYREQMDKVQNKALDMFLEKGTEAIFGEETHFKIMEGIENSKDKGTVIGNGAVAVADSLIQESTGLQGNERVQSAIYPAGTILIADVGEYLNRSGIPFTDEDYEQATHVFQTKIGNKYDPKFRAKMQQYGGDQQQQPQQGQAMPPEQAQGAMVQPGAGGEQPGGALLNMTGRG